MTTQAKAKRDAKPQWPRWKILMMALGVFGSLGALLTFIPGFSLVWAILGGFLTLLQAANALRIASKKDWWGEVAYIVIWHIFLIGIGVRAWVALIGMPLMWGLIFISLYLTAWALPAVAPRISALLFREQLQPSSTVGRGCISIALIVGPSVGGVAALLGSFGRKYVYEGFPYLVVGILCIITVVGWGQYASHQLWPKRPWAEREQE